MSRFGLAGNGDDRIRHFQRGFFDPKRKIVSAAELFAFPRSQRLERMHRNDQRYTIILFRQDPAEVGVPGVAMHQIGVDVQWC